MCTVLLPPGVNPTAVKIYHIISNKIKYITSYQIIQHVKEIKQNFVLNLAENARRKAMD
jgi:hypothetical protein